MTGIYLITNKVNGKQYVGQSADIEGRWKKHIRDINNYDCVIYRALRKYGIENFSFEVLEECDVDKLDEREIYWINELDTYKNGYNMTLGGGGRNEGKESYSKEYRKEYYQDHKEDKKLYMRQYREEHKEEHKQYYQDHKEEIKQYKKQWYQEHKEERKQSIKQYREDHKEYYKQYQKQYRASKKAKTMKIHIDIEIPLW